MKVEVGSTGVDVGRGVAVSGCVGAGVSVGAEASGPTEQARVKRTSVRSKVIFFMFYGLVVGVGEDLGFGVLIGQPVRGVKHGHGYISNAFS